MSGTNPYQTTEAAGLPKQAYRLTFLPMDLTIDVDPGELPASGEGLPGSILDIALANDIDIDHACGGVCACSTCHIIVRAGEESCPESSEDEEDMLDLAFGLTHTSRLGCQITITDALDGIEFALPAETNNQMDG